MTEIKAESVVLVFDPRYGESSTGIKWGVEVEWLLKA